METKEKPGAAGGPTPGSQKFSHANYATDIPSKPTPLSVAVECIPAKLRKLLQWLVWKYECRADKSGGGKWTKPPLCVRGGPGRSNDPTTWCDFETAVSAYRSGKYDGIGFAFHPNDGLAGIDLDHCRNPETGELAPWAQEMVSRFAGTYIEISPSGEGIRIFAKGKAIRCGKGTEKKAVELYDHSSPRYLTVTGHQLPGSATEITEQREALEWLHREYFQPREREKLKGNGQDHQQVFTGTDAEIIAKASRAKNGAKFTSLLSGNTEGYPSQSEADAALCSRLAFYTQEAGQIDRIFRGSGLMREKWDRKHHSDGSTYGETTIRRAIEGRTETYRDAHSRIPPGENPHRPGDDGYMDSLMAEADSQGTAGSRDTVGKLNSDQKRATLERLAGLDPVSYAVEAGPAAKALGIHPAALDRAVATIRSDLADPESDPIVPPPRPDPAMLYGLVGEVARAAADGTEVNPVAAALAYLTFLAAHMGRDVYLTVGNTWHHARIYGLHIGRSGRGGKGDAQGLTHRIRRRMKEVYAGTLGQTHTGGLSSREGLALFIHNGFKSGKEDIPAIEDKRLWIVESEFANVLHQTKRDGNTLSAALRDAWDGNSIKPAVKHSPIWASKPHIGLLGNVTPSELLSMLESRELSNGFANRFLMVWAECIGETPFPKTATQEKVDEFTSRSAEVIWFARGRYPETQDSRRMTLSPDAEAIYRAAYRELRRPVGNELLTAILERRAPYALRLAMVFALTDRTLVIGEPHIRAALAWVRYAVKTVRFVFSERAGSAAAGQTEADARTLMEFLRDKPTGASLTEIGNDAFGKRASSSRISAAIKALLTANPPKITMDERPRSDGRPGKPSTIYRAVLNISADLAEIAEIGAGRGFGGNAELGGLSGIGSDSATDRSPLMLTPRPNSANSANSANGSGPRLEPISAISAKSANIHEKSGTDADDTESF